MSVFRLPLQPQSQAFFMQLGTVTYRMVLKWNSASNVWVLDIYDTSLNLIAGGIPLISGADLLEQYRYLGFSGSLIAQQDADVDLPPDYNGLGSTANLYYVPDAVAT